MKTLIFEGVMTALTSISHIGETRGIVSSLRREKAVLADGSIELIPTISGNSIRGILRDKGMMHMLRLLGYGEDCGIDLNAFYFLLSGGALESTGKRGLDISEARKWRDPIPLVAIFGGAMGNQIMPGKLNVGKAIPICYETAHLIPERYATNLCSVWDLCQEEPYTRRDDAKNENMRYMINPSTLLLLDEKSEKTREKRIRGEAETEIGQKQQMRYLVETLAAGTRMFFTLAL